MADPTTPVWVPILAPVVSALATWATTKFELLSFQRLKPYQGVWYAYYRDPDKKCIEEEVWTFTPLGRVEVSRNGRTTFKGRLSLRGQKAYMEVQSTASKDERLVVMLDSPTDPRSGDSRASVCIWLGQNKNHNTVAGHGLLSRVKLPNCNIHDEFLIAEV